MPLSFSPMKVSVKGLGIAFFLSGVIGFSTPALAGFQWVAPSDQAEMSPPATWTPPAPPPVQSMPMTSASPGIRVRPLAGENPEVISPIVIEGQPPLPAAAKQMAPPPALAPAPVASTNYAPPKMQEPSLGVLPASSSSSETVVQGFANSVPLPVALRQILPPGYGFSIDQDVDLSTLVSFRGGQSWRDTLQTTLQPVNLTMHEQGQMISISHMQSAMTSPPSSPAPEASPPIGTPPPTSYAGANSAANSAPTPITPSLPSSPPARIVSPWPPMASVNGAKPEVTQPTLMPLNIPAPPLGGASSPTGAWAGSRGDTLRKVLENWSRNAGVEVEWLSEYDYPLQASVSYTGSFEDAVRSLLSGFEEAHPQPVAALHANPGAGQTVLVVETRGNSYSD